MKPAMLQFADHRVSRRGFVQSLTALGISTVGMPAIVRATGVGEGLPSVGRLVQDSGTYVFSHLTTHPQKTEAFVAMMEGLHPLTRKHGGWILHGAYLQISDHTGPHTAVIDVWEVPDADTSNDLAGMGQDPAMAQVSPLLQESFAGETLQVMRKLPVKIPSWDETAGSSPTHMFAHVTLKPGTVDTFTDMLGDLAPIFYKHRGWKLRGSYLPLGPLGDRSPAVGAMEGLTDTATAIWEVPDINAIVTNLKSSLEDPAYQKLEPAMQECVAGEVQQVMTKLPVKLAYA